MKILLVQSTIYVPTHGGENKANRLLMEGLAERGHSARVVAPSCGAQGPGARAQFLNELAARGLSATASPTGADVFHQNGVEVHAVTDPSQLRLHVANQIRDFDPTWTLVSSEDPGQILLETALEATPTRVVYVAHTMLFFPFGPHCFLASKSKTELLGQTAGIITVSNYLKDYIRRWGRCESSVIPFPVYGSGPFPEFGRFDQGFVTMVNPCAYKGVSIFLELARKFPEVGFAAVASWGTTSADRAALERLPNVKLLNPVDGIDEIFAQTRILLMPSLWGEGFPLTPVEAMLRGIPVIASDSGGLPESKLGTDYVLPVRSIERYSEHFDDRKLPIAEVPKQDTGPWAEALGRLLTDRAHYDYLSTASREVALNFNSNLSVAPFEEFLQKLTSAASVSRSGVAGETQKQDGKMDDLLRKQMDQLSPERRALLALRLKKKAGGEASAKKQIIPRRSASRRPPLSFQQERLWFFDQMEPGNSDYNNLDAFRLSGSLNIAALERSLSEIVERHEALRTTFAIEDERPVQVVNKAEPLKLSIIDLRQLSEAERNAEAHRLGNQEARRPFNLNRGPLLRASLLQIKDAEYVLLLAMHHIVSDGWSFGIFIRELAALYEAYSQGQPLSPLQELPIQYADYAVWQREQQLQGAALEGQLAYWKQQLAGAPDFLNLPTDKVRPPTQSHRSKLLPLTIPKSLSEKLKAISQKEGATLYMSLLAAFQMLLARYTQQEDILVGSAIAGRTRAETEELIGFFVNTLVFRTNLSGNPTFGEVLARVRKVALGAYAHQDIPIEKLVEELQPERSVNRNALFQTMFVFQNAPRQALELPGLSLESINFGSAAGARTDVDFYLWEAPEGLGGYFIYNHDLFEESTIERMSERFQVLVESIVQNPDARLADRQLDREIELPSIPPPMVAEAVDAPLSYHQERLWFIDQFETGNVYESHPVYHNLPLVLHLAGAVDRSVLESSLNKVINRHAALRTRIVTKQDQNLQVVSAPGDNILKLKVVDLDANRAQRTSIDDVIDLALDEAQESFDLSRDLPVRATLYRANQEESVLIITVHHIIADKQSLQLIAEELAEVYSAKINNLDSRLPQLALQYTDYTEWQRRLPAGAFERPLFYWKWQLRGRLQALELPEDRLRPAVHTYTAAHLSFSLSAELAQRIKRLSEHEDASSGDVLLAAFKALLHRYARQNEIIVGTSVPGREQPGTQHIIGPLSNLLVLRSDLAGNPSFRTLMAEVKKTLSAARAHQEMPFDKLVQALNPEKDMSRTALFDVLFSYQEKELPSFVLGDATARFIDTNLGHGKYDLNISLHGGGNMRAATGEGLSGTLIYNADIYDTATITGMMQHFERLLDSVTADPEQRIDDVRLLSEKEEQQQLVDWNRTDAVYPKDKTIHQLFAEQVGRTPDKTAVVCGSKQLSYRQLDAQANRLAHHLRSQGVRSETLVGVCLSRSVEMIVALLGVIKAGGAYVPLDAAYPPERLRFMVEDSGMTHLITTQALLGSVPEQLASTILLDMDSEQLASYPVSAPESEAVPESLAYVIYTSGSTGKPKGVLIEHGNVVRLMLNDEMPFAFTEQDVWTMFHSYCFDFSVWEMYGALLYGGRLVVVPEEIQKDPALYFELLRSERVTVLNQTPTAFYNLAQQALARGADRAPQLALRYVIFGGEALHPVQLGEWRQCYPAVKLINMYGITETTVHVTFKEIGEQEIKENVSNIGRAIPTTSVYIMDERQRLLPVGVPGEVCVGGAGVGRGYLGREELTSERFVANPYRRAERMYRSGDLAKLLRSGELVYLGRIDDQVQIRGFRVELGEVRSQLLEHGAVAEAEVVARKLMGEQLELVAYVVAKREVSVTELRQHIAERLPYYMVPVAFVMMKGLPVTANGKVDRRALPAPDQARPEVESTFVAPRNQIEEALANVWAEVLNLERVGVNDNFFELGGHSLLATQVVSRVRASLEVELPLRTLFENPTVGGLAERIETTTGQAEQIPLLLPVSRNRELPLSFAQQRLWFLDQMESGTFFFNIPAAVRLSGSLNTSPLEQSLNEIVRRHETLRTTFANVSGKPVQVIAPSLVVTLPITELGNLRESEREAEISRLVSEEAKRPFDLAHGPLFRASLLRLSKTEHVLLLVMHHIIFDDWSAGVLFRELTTLYEAYSTNGDAAAVVLPELSIQYADYAVWQKERLDGERLERKLSYWKQQLKGAPPLLSLPTDRPRPLIQTLRGANQYFTLPKELSESLKALGQDQGGTLFMILLAAFKTLLMRQTGVTDIVVGTDAANRNRVEIENLIGFFINHLVLRTDLSDDPTFTELLKRVRKVALNAYAGEEVPFEKVVEAINPKRSQSYTPLFQVLFTFQNAPRPTQQFSDLTLSPIKFHGGTAKYDLTLFMEETDQGLSGSLDYNTDIFDPATIKRTLSQFEILLGSIVAQPTARLSALEIHTESERKQKTMEKREQQESSFKKFKGIKPKAISLPQQQLVKTGYLKPGEMLPLVVQPEIGDINLAEWAKSNGEMIETNLGEHGAILFRGFNINAATDFEQFALSLTPELFNENGEHPREIISGNVYTPVFYPQEKKILMHNENSFNYRWPVKIWFCCMKPAQQGGETPIADSRKVYEMVDPKIRQQFEEKGVMYVRNYGTGLGLDWQTVFQTEERAVVEEKCRQTLMDYEWKDDGGLRTSCVRPGVIKHPKTGAMSWFNQAQHWHVACLEPAVRESLLSMFREADLPRHCYYGDGSPIEDSAMREILGIYEKLEISFTWQRGDIIMLDNMLTAHARNPFVGERKILVAMGEMMDQIQVGSRKAEGGSEESGI